MDSFRAEETFFAEGFPAADAPDELPVTPVQLRGSSEYLRGAPGERPDYTREVIADPEVLNLALGGIRSNSSPGLLRLSASHIDAYRACPYAYLLSKGLLITETALEVDPDDAFEIGRLYHDILAEFYGELASAGGTFRADELDVFKSRMLEIADRIYRQHRGMIPDLVYDAHRETFDHIAEIVLGHDATVLAGHAPLLVEAWQREQESEEGYVLVGRVDRVSRDSDGLLTLVDYKKSRTPTKASIHAGSTTSLGSDLSSAELATQRARLGSVQIPLYVRLLESSGERVASAWFYGLENGEFRQVFDMNDSGDACMTRDRLDEVITLVDAIVTDMVGRIRDGDFRCADDCAGCAMRAICRTRFHVR
jgi:hypothetical protein